MRVSRRCGAVLALSLLASLAADVGGGPGAAMAQETPESLRQGLIQVADVIGGMSPEAAGEAAALRSTLMDAEPDVLTAMQAELSRRTAWKGTGHLLQTLAQVGTLRSASVSAAVAAVSCGDPTLECPDTSAQCAPGQKLDVQTHIGIFISQQTFDLVAIGLEATCGAVGALAEELGTPFCLAAGVANLTIRLLTIPAEISDICGGGELEADVLGAVISQAEATTNEMQALGDKLGAVTTIENLRVENALASCTRISTLMLPETSLNRITACSAGDCSAGKCKNDAAKDQTCANDNDCCFSQTDLEGSFLRTLELVQGLYGGAKRAGGLSTVKSTTAAKKLAGARTKFDARAYGEAFKELCDAYQQLK